MATVTAEARNRPLLTLGFEAENDLTQYAAVVPSGAAAARMTVDMPGGQGALSVGFLQDVAADAVAGKFVEITCIGRTRAIAQGAYNSGIELTPNGANGRLEAAASGDYVCAIAVSAASAAAEIVVVDAVRAYQKN